MLALVRTRFATYVSLELPNQGVRLAKGVSIRRAGFAAGRGKGTKKGRPSRDRERKLEASAIAREWNGYEDMVRQGLHDLEGPSVSSRRDANYVRQPLVSEVDEEKEEIKLEQTRKTVTDQMERVWNRILLEDSRASTPRVTLPGFPIEVGDVKVSRDFRHQTVYWCLSQRFARVPQALSEQLDKANKQGYDPEAVVLKAIAKRLEKSKGFLRTTLARRFPMKRVPEVNWCHLSKRQLF
ncbi:unnamed protein product [Discosporangium mesarthrocarpum]